MCNLDSESVTENVLLLCGEPAPTDILLHKFYVINILHPIWPLGQNNWPVLS